MHFKNLFFGLVIATPTVLFAQNVGIGTTNPTALFSVAERFKVDGATGSVTITHPNGTINFTNPSTTNNKPMMVMFKDGTHNHNRMLVGHSNDFPTFGLQYQDSADNFVFRADNLEVFNVKLGDRRIKYTDGNEKEGRVLVSDANGVGTWRDNIYSSPWMNSPFDVRDTTIDGTCVRIRHIMAPQLTAEVLSKGLVTVYMRVGSIGPYQLPYISDAGAATNQINCIFNLGKILIYRHTYNSCRFNSSIPESFPGQYVLVNLPQSLEYRYVITK